MIPKIIHYCWLSSDPIPLQFEEYIKSWKVQLPDYEFMLWNFDTFDIDESIWVKEAFENKKYADTKILQLVIKEVLASDFTIVPVSSLAEASLQKNDPYEIKVLPSEYFSPKYYWTGKVEITNNTVCIHHFFGSWLPQYLRIEAMIYKGLGIKNFKIIERMTWKLRALKLMIFK